MHGCFGSIVVFFDWGRGGGKRVCFFEYIHHRKFKSSRVSLNIFKWCD